MSARQQPRAVVGFVKAHAYGNDFLFVEEDEVGAGQRSTAWRETSAGGSTGSGRTV